MRLVTTQCQDEVRILSSRTQKLKVAKRCCKQLDKHNLMYIYHKQCENMQTNHLYQDLQIVRKQKHIRKPNEAS